MWVQVRGLVARIGMEHWNWRQIDGLGEILEVGLQIVIVD